MSTPNDPRSTPKAPESGQGSTPRRRPWRRWLLLGIIPSLAASAFFLPRAFAGGPWGGGWHRCDHGGGARDAEQLRARMSQRLDRMLERIDATDEQRAEVARLVEARAPRLFEYKKQGRQLRQRFLAAVQAEPIDAAELQAVREQGLELADEASAGGIELLQELATILTAEQRARVREHMLRFARVHH